MKIITITQIGWNTPSNANWSYKVFTITKTDTKKNTITTQLAKSTFGEHYGIIEKLKEKGNKVFYSELFNTQKITGIREIPSIHLNLFNF